MDKKTKIMHMTRSSEKASSAGAMLCSKSFGAGLHMVLENAIKGMNREGGRV